MDPSLTSTKNSEDPQDKESSPSKPLDDKVSSLQNSEDDSRPTSAPTKLYSGSLFLYSDDLYGYLTQEGHDSREDDQYNKFFNYPKPKKTDVTLSKGMVYTNGEGRSTSNKDLNKYTSSPQDAKNGLNLSRQNSESLADARLSPDSANQAIMGVFSEGDHPHESKHSDSQLDASDSHKGEGRSRGGKKSKSYNSPKKVPETQPYPQAMYPPSMMMGQPQYMMRPTQPYMNVNMNMMPQDYNYMMGGDNRMYGRGMMGYSMPVMNYYPYSMYPQNNMQMPPNYGNAYMAPGNPNPQSNPNQNQKQRNQQDSHNKNTGNSGHNTRQQSHNKDNNGNQHKNNQKGNKDRDREREKDRDSGNQNQKKDKKKDNNATNTSNNAATANLQSLGPDEQEQLIEDSLNLAKDQAGCRLLQQKLETNDPEARDRIFEKVIGNFDKLMIDPFGNYFCQKIAETCSDSQTKRIIEAVSPSIIAICLNPHGTRAVQKLIEIVKTESLVKMLAKALSVDVVGLVKDNHGNHVIQKCLTNMSEGSRQFIYDSITENCVEIATHKHGCCVMQRCLDFASKAQKNSLVRVIANNTLDLVEDQYGNYVVQYILDLKEKEGDIPDIVGESLIGHVVELSKQKFSSNVIEKCLQLNILAFRQHFMELISESDVLVELICDQFGNYVIQRCLNNADDELKNHILEAIHQNAQAINEDPFGNKIYTKLAKNYNFLGDTEATSSHTLSPRVSEEGNTRPSNKRGNKGPGNNNKNNNRNNANENKQRGKNNNKNNEKRNSHTGSMPKNSRNSMDQDSGNYQNRHQRGSQRHSSGGQVMYSHQPEMMAPPNMGNPMMQPGYYMAQPQMYGQFYGYPQMQQSDAGYNRPR